MSEVSAKMQKQIDGMMDGLMGEINTFEAESVVLDISKMTGLIHKPLRDFVQDLFVKRFLGENKEFFKWCAK